MPDYIVDGPLFVLATVMVLGRRSAMVVITLGRRIVTLTRRYARIAWNAAIRTFILWSLDQALKVCIWRIARRDGMNAAEKKAFADKLWLEATSEDPKVVSAEAEAEEEQKAA